MRFISSKSAFFRNTLTLFSGTAIAQALPILLSPILARIYDAEDFAILAIITPLITIGAIISTLRLDIAVVIPKEEKEAKNLFFTSLVFNLIIVLFTTFCALFINLFFNYDGILLASTKKLLWYVPLGIFALGWYTAYNYWSTRNKTYKNNAISKVVQSVINISVCIIFGYFIPGAEGLILGMVLGYLIGLFVLYFRQKKEVPFSEIYYLRKENLKIILKKYKNFIIINTPHASLSIFAEQGVVYFLKMFFNNAIIGSFAFAYRYTKAPLSIITSSISQVFYEDASTKANRGEDIRPTMFKIQKNMFLFTFPFYVVGIIWAPEIFGFVFSMEYYHAGEIASIILPWIYLNFLVSPISTITLIFNKQKEALILAIIDLTLRATAIVIGGIYKDWEITFQLLNTVCCIYLIFVSFWYFRIAKPNPSKRY